MCFVADSLAIPRLKFLFGFERVLTVEFCLKVIALAPAHPSFLPVSQQDPSVLGTLVIKHVTLDLGLYMGCL